MGEAIAVADGVFWQAVGEELAVFTDDGDAVFTLNEVGSLILAAIAEGTPTSAVAESLSKRFGQDTATCVEIVDRFVEQLRDEGLVVDRPDGT